MQSITVEDLGATRSGRAVFRGLSFKLKSGEALVLTGPNGSGKSTLLRILASLGDVASGKIEFGGLSDEQKSAEACHYIAHADALKPALTARENLSFWARFFEAGDPLEALEAFSISHLADIPAGLLSAGQKRRLGLARLALAPRALWLLDEPSVSLDAASQEILAGLMQDHTKKGGMIIAATHLPLGLDNFVNLDLHDFKAPPDTSWQDQDHMADHGAMPPNGSRP